MKNKITLFAIFICLISCHQKEQKETVQDSLLTANNDSAKTGKKTPNNGRPHGLSALSDTLIINLKMDSANDQIIVPLAITSGKELYASVSSNDTNANIRVSQVEAPDSTFDGPFGKNLHYKMKAPGNYKIIIGENMMAADRWKGDFVLRVWVR
jgi:hypothetical protein